MKESERKRKYNEFIKLHKEGLSSAEIISKLGIAVNTLYNWRKKQRNQPNLHKTAPDSPLQPFFSKVISQPSISHYIEIEIGSSVVIRIPYHSQEQTLQQILDTVLEHGDSKR
jgi:transposase-like protein